jgi:hypothetical protein
MIYCCSASKSGTRSRPYTAQLFNKFFFYKILPFKVRSSSATQKIGLSFLIFVQFLTLVFHFMLIQIGSGTGKNSVSGTTKTKSSCSRAPAPVPKHCLFSHLPSHSYSHSFYSAAPSRTTLFLLPLISLSLPSSSSLLFFHAAPLPPFFSIPTFLTTFHSLNKKNLYHNRR